MSRSPASECAIGPDDCDRPSACSDPLTKKHHHTREEHEDEEERKMQPSMSAHRRRTTLGSTVPPSGTGFESCRVGCARSIDDAPSSGDFDSFTDDARRGSIRRRPPHPSSVRRRGPSIVCHPREKGWQKRQRFHTADCTMVESTRLGLMSRYLVASAERRRRVDASGNRRRKSRRSRITGARQSGGPIERWRSSVDMQAY